MIAPKISVIVPVYNVEKYLQECVDSILNQSFTDFELILVDDGSPDNSGSICDLNKEKDLRIRVIHQKNQGVTRARANGVNAAKGDFITFVDSDDTLLPEALALLWQAVTPETDIVLASHTPSPLPQKGEIPLAEYRRLCVTMQEIQTEPFAKLFRRTLFNQEVFNLPPELKVGEDAVMNIRLAYGVTGKVYNTGLVIYKYRDNPESVMHTCAPNPESNAMLQFYRLSSIPSEDVEKFLPNGLANSLVHYWINSTMNTIFIPNSALSHYFYVRTIIKYANPNLCLWSKLLVLYKNPLLRACLILPRRILKRIKR